MRLGLQGIPEEDQEVDLPFHDLAADLLVAPERTALQGHDVEPQRLAKETARRSSCVELMSRQQLPVEPRPLQELLLLVVVCNQRETLCRFREQFLICHE